VFRKLRTRLVVSHALPLLVLTSVLGLVIFYLVETRYSFNDLAAGLERQGGLVLEYTHSNTAIWSDAQQARRLIDQISPHMVSRIMLLDKEGRLLASSLDTDGPRLGRNIQADVVQNALQGVTSWEVDYNPFMQRRIVDMARPVLDNEARVIGILRFSQDISEIEQPLVPLRFIVFGTILLGIVTALTFGVMLARSLSLPLSRLTEAVTRLVPGTPAVVLPEDGPDEVRTVASGYNQLVHRLQEIELERRQFLANVVHELGTPLGAVKAATQALQNGAITDQDLAQELMSGITTQIDQLSLLIDDLALLGETERRELTLRCIWLDLDEVVRGKCQIYSYLAQQKQITLNYNTQGGLLPVFADITRLRQILANLLQNACKYTPIGGHIEVVTEMEVHGTSPDRAIVRVSDSGPGVALDEQEKIFQISYRGSTPRKRHQGMGIGLALARRLAEAHGGTLTIRSQPGNGSMFTLCLPIKQPE
jgi:signal transduction histidine kinase